MELNFRELSEKFLNCRKHSLLAGFFDQNYIAWASNDSIRIQASSGGITTAIAIFLLNNKYVNKIIVIKSSSEKSPLDFRGTIVDSEADLMSAMGSKYCSVTLCGALKDLGQNDKALVIGLPCHIQGIRKAQLNDHRFRKLNIILLGLFCGSTRGREGAEWMIKQHGFEIDKLSTITFRGGGWPGYLRASFVNGKTLKLPYPDYSCFQFSGYRPWRCGLCSDGLAELADLSIGDAWLKEYTSVDDKGVCVIVARSERGKKILLEGVSQGIIHCVDGDDDIAVKSQYQMLINKKYKIYGGFLLAHLLGRSVPLYDNIGEKISLKMGISRFISEIKGLAGWIVTKNTFLNKLFTGR